MRIMKILRNTALFIIILISGIYIISAQNTQANRIEDIIYQDRNQNQNLIMPTGENNYITTQDGIIRMYVNVWGEVQKPGTHLVYEDINITALLSACGGPTEGANLSRVKIIRENGDSLKSTIKMLDIENFLDSGSREDIITLKPNDTVIIPERITHRILSNLNLLNTSLQLISLYFQIDYYRARTN